MYMNGLRGRSIIPPINKEGPREVKKNLAKGIPSKKEKESGKRVVTALLLRSLSVTVDYRSFPFSLSLSVIR